jgi:uncharacterized cupin superfamily protein
MLQSAICNWEDASQHETPTGAVRLFLHGPTATLQDLDVHVTTVNPGLTMPSPPPHAKEEILILKDGVVEVLLHGEWKKFSPGSVLFNSSFQVHGLRNTGTNTASYYVITWSSDAGNRNR